MARYLAFLETVRQQRPALHRFCARMTGSVLDGEDMVQEALLQAYRNLDTFDDTRPMGPWLFRIAHNRCIDHLRRRRVREAAEVEVARPEAVEPAEISGPGIGHALEYLVLALPPKERACLLLKDVFDYSLEDIAALVDSTVGGVKAALHRGRARLARRPSEPQRPRARMSDEAQRLRDLYIERFNRRDWDGLRLLIADDARVRIPDRYAGTLLDAPYFANYAQRAAPWQLAAGVLDGVPVVFVLARTDAGWAPRTVVRLEVVGERIAAIADYTHCPWVVSNARDIQLHEDS